MRKLLFALALCLPLAAGAQKNRYEDVVPMLKYDAARGGGLFIKAKAAGAEQIFAIDPLRNTSITPTGATLERLEISPNHFVPTLKTAKGEVPEGVVAILGRDAFRQSVLTINGISSNELSLASDFKWSQTKSMFVMLSSPYKPEWMPLASRKTITPNMVLDTLLTEGAVAFDFARGRYYSLALEDVPNLAAVDEPTKTSVSIAISVSGTSKPADKPAATGEIEHLTTLDFLKKVSDIRSGEQWKYLGSEPCVIDFWAPWCAPCLRMNPGVEALAREYAGRVKVYKVNIDEEKELKEYFGAVAIPMFVFIPMSGAPRPVMGSSIEVVRTEMQKLVE